MKKSVAFCIIILNLACTNPIDVRTADNYETVSLADNSQVYLNHNSSITYDKDFNPRTVYLSGEAFFTVVPSKSVFTVVTEHGNVEVLGTEFNVKTTSKQIAVDVNNGLVELKTEYDSSKLKKGIKAIYKDGEQTIQQIESNREYRNWILSFKKEFKKLGKELKPALKNIGNDFKEAGKRSVTN